MSRDFREVANEIAAYRAAEAAGEDVLPPYSPCDEIAQAQRAHIAEDALLDAVRALYALEAGLEASGSP